MSEPAREQIEAGARAWLEGEYVAYDWGSAPEEVRQKARVHARAILRAAPDLDRRYELQAITRELRGLAVTARHADLLTLGDELDALATRLARVWRPPGDTEDRA